MSSGIKHDVYHDRVEIKMVGSPLIVIARPTRIPLFEWEKFWGTNHPRMYHNSRPFTPADAEANNTRRLAALESK